MDKANRQAFLLRGWSGRNRKKTDPHFSTKGVLSPALTEYIASCYQSGTDPRLFLTAWIDPRNKTISVGVAEQYAEPKADRVPTLDDFYSSLEDMDE